MMLQLRLRRATAHAALVGMLLYMGLLCLTPGRMLPLGACGQLQGDDSSSDRDALFFVDEMGSLVIETAMVVDEDEGGDGDGDGDGGKASSHAAVLLNGIDLLPAIEALKVELEAEASTHEALKNTLCFEHIPVTSLPTIDARSTTAFAIDGTHYLAVANTHDGDNYMQPSKIYEWSPRFTRYDMVQDIATVGNIHWEFFSVGDAHFLAAANANSLETRALNVTVHLWNATLAQFQPHQEIPALGAGDVAHFRFDGMDFLAISNFYDRVTHNLDVQVLVWNPDTGLFETFQRIPIKGSVNLEYFSIDGSHFLASANFVATTSTTPEYVIDSQVFIWDGNEEAFVLYQNITTSGASDFEYVEVGGSSFLVVANFRDNENNRDVASELFRWNPSVKRFESHQLIPTVTSHDWEAFSADGATYLVNTGQGASLYKFVVSQDSAEDDPVISLELVATFPGLGTTYSSEFFRTGGLERLVLSTADNTAAIYTWNGCSFF